MPSAAGRHQLELLVDEAGLDLVITHWPLPRAAVSSALDALPSALPIDLDRARAQLRRELDALARASASLTLRNTDDTLAGYGDDATRGSSIGLRSTTFGAAAYTAQFGARVDAQAQGTARGGGTWRFEESAVALEAGGVQLQGWSHRSWWGPGWQSSLVLGNNAPALIGLGLQRASASRSDSRWLAWLGPWNFEFFIARGDGAGQSESPFLVGQRLTLRPFANLEIGLTRTAQWGGSGHDQSARSFLNMLAGIGLNADTAAQKRADPANELAGYDFRLRCPFGVRCAGYVQLIGEDRAGLWPSRFLGLYGVEAWSADGGQRYHAEVAETGCRAPIGRAMLTPCAYRNSAYPDGYASAGRWLGAGVGPDSRLFTLGWLDAASGTSLRLDVGRIGAGIGAYTPQTRDAATSGRLVGMSARREFRWVATTITPTLDWIRIAAPAGTRRELRAGATLQVSLGGAD